MFLLILLILGCLSLILWKLVEKYDLEPPATFIVAMAVIFAAIAMITYTISLGTIADMEAFYERNYAMYTQSVKEFPNSGKAITKNDATTVITLPYDRVKLIAEYNSDLTWYKRYQKHWFIGGFVGKIPHNLNYITLP